MGCTLMRSTVNGMLMWIRFIDHWIIIFPYLPYLILNSVLLSRVKAHRIHFRGITESYREGKQKRKDAKRFVVQCLEQAFLAETEWWTFPAMQDVAVVTHRDHCDSLSGCYARRVVEIHSTNERAGAWRPIGNVTAFESCGFRIKIIMQHDPNLVFWGGFDCLMSNFDKCCVNYLSTGVE